MKLESDPGWLRLLHFHSNLLTRKTSDIDGPDFFLSKHGRTNAGAELDATIHAFFEPMPISTDTQHPRCRYPARYDWLNEKLNLDGELPPMACARYESWREKIDPAGLSIVFSSYYLNNPASMYGHTFLRVKRKAADGQERPLLDYCINFAALANAKNGLAFAVLGLLGGYPGTFTVAPYYMKVQTYNNLESRDLWEYDLNLSTESVERLLKHTWEMRTTSMRYYFFNKNCSYQLLPLLEAVEPTLQLSDRFRFRAIPIDTLSQVIHQDGLLKKVTFRASAFKKMQAARDCLSAPERKAVECFVSAHENDINVQNLTLERQRAIWDAAYRLLHYHAGYYRDQPKDVQERERKILLALNALPASTENVCPEPVTPIPPQAAHPTGRWTLGIGANRESAFEEIGARGALHDLEADPAGFVAGSQLEMMSFRARIENETGHGYLEEFTGIQIKSLSPWEPWIRKPTWQLWIGYGRAHDLDQNPNGSGFAGVAAGYGASTRVPRFHDMIAYAMLKGDGNVGGVFRDNYRLGIGPEAGVVGGFTRKLRIHFIASYLRYGAGDISDANRLRVIQAYQLPSNYETRLTLSRENHYREGVLSLNRYF